MRVPVCLSNQRSTHQELVDVQLLFNVRFVNEILDQQTKLLVKKVATRFEHLSFHII